MAHALDVCVLGRIGYDLYALEHGRPLGEVESFTRRLGGSSANIAVGLARLGLRVGMVSAVGDNLLADYLLGFLEKEGVSTQLVRRVAGFSTSLCLTEVAPPSGFRQVFYRDRPADTQVEVREHGFAEDAIHALFNNAGASAPAIRGSRGSRASRARSPRPSPGARRSVRDSSPRT